MGYILTKEEAVIRYIFDLRGAKVIRAKDSAFIPTLNAHVPQDNGTYEANEKQDLSTS